MGFKTQGRQQFPSNYTAKSAVNGRCGTPSTTQCITSTLTGTTTTPTSVTISATITAMTTTSITYTINSINNLTLIGTSYSFTSSINPDFYIKIDNGNATSTLPSSIVVGTTYTTLLSQINLSLGTYTVTINNGSSSWLNITSQSITLTITS